MPGHARGLAAVRESSDSVWVLALPGSWDEPAPFFDGYLWCCSAGATKCLGRTCEPSVWVLRCDFFQFPQHAARGGVLGQALAADEKVPFKAPGTFGITIGLPRSCLAPDCAQLGRLFSDVCAGGPLGPQFVGNRVSMT